MNTSLRLVRPLLLLGALALLSGCASLKGPDPRDPWEPMNRKVYQFNDTVDRMFMRPVATAYNKVTPRPVRVGVSNFFNNASDYWSVINNAAQLKPEPTVAMAMRVSLNTVVGLGGVLDIASEVGIERYKEDLGQTLGRWGVPQGPFVVLPLLGPSTVRDTLALTTEAAGSPINRVTPIRTRNQLTLLDGIDTRASYLRAGQVLQEAALDPYSFTRDVYLQKRRNDTYDGRPPEEEDPEPEAPAAPSTPAAVPPAAPASAAASASAPAQ